MIKKIKNMGIIFFKKLNSIKKIKNLKKIANKFTLKDLIIDLKKFGIKQGDVVFVHSSLKSIGYVEGGPDTVINAFLKVIGDTGTLVIPTYSNKGTMYGTCIDKNYIFDKWKKKTNLGAIPSAFLKYKELFRSIHPTHSVSAIGRFAKEITDSHFIGNKTYGENSPWGKLIELNGKILGIGVSLHVNAQYHYLEDMLEDQFPIKVKLDKVYKLKCKIGNNEFIEVEVQPLDPEVAKTRIDKKDNQFIRDYFWELFERRKILHTGNIGESISWWVDANECYEFLRKLVKLGITIYSTKKDLVNKKLYPFDLVKERLKM